MKKTKLLTVTLLGAVLALAGCGEGKTSSSEAASSSAEESSSTVASSSSSSEASSKSSSSEASSSSESSSSSSSSTDATDKEEILGVLEDSIAGQSAVKSAIYNDSYGSQNPYEFGVDKYGTFIQLDTSYDTSYYGYRANGTVYGIKYSKYSQQLSSAYQVVDENLYGAKVYVSPLYQSDVFDGYIYGAQGFLELAQAYVGADANKDAKVDDFSTETEYSFEFGVVNQDWNGNTRLIVFTYDLTIAGGTVTTLGVAWSVYSGENIEADYETNTYHVAEDGSPSDASRISFDQTVGERTLENPYDIETLYYTSITYLDSTGAEMGDEYSVSNGSQLSFSVGDYAPETANPNIDTPTITYEGGVQYGISTGFYQGQVNIYTYNEGDYACTLKTANTSKTFTLHVTAAVPQSVSSVTSYVKEGDSYAQSTVDDSGVSMYAGGSVSLTASFSPYKASQDFVMEVVGDNADDATIASDTIYTSQWDSTGTSVYTFTSSVVGTYQVKISSATEASVTKTITIEVKEAPELASLLAKRYVCATAEPGVGVRLLNDVSFTPSESDVKVGTVSVGTYDYDAGAIVTNVCSYTYDETTKTFALTKDGAAFSDVALSFSGSFKLLATTGSGDEAVTTTLTEFDAKTVITGVGGSWSATTSNEASFKLSFNTYSQTVDVSLSKYDEEYNMLVDAYISDATFTVSETEDGYSIILADDVLEALASKDSSLGGDPCLGGITSIVVAKDFSKMEATLIINDVSETVECSWSRW